MWNLFGSKFHVYQFDTWMHGPRSTCTDVTSGGSMCWNFCIGVRKIGEGDIHTIDGLEVDSNGNTMAAVARVHEQR